MNVNPAAVSAPTLTAALIIAVFLLALFLFWFIRYRHVPSDQENGGEFPYEPRPLLTDNEDRFYQALRPIADRCGLHLLAKVRVADFIGVCSGLEKTEYGRFFSKIQAKHVDFMLSDPDTLEPVLLVEVDDSTHDTASRQERDDFLDGVYRQAGIPILHIREMEQLEEAILQLLDE